MIQKRLRGKPDRRGKQEKREKGNDLPTNRVHTYSEEDFEDDCKYREDARQLELRLNSEQEEESSAGQDSNSNSNSSTVDAGELTSNTGSQEEPDSTPTLLATLQRSGDQARRRRAQTEVRKEETIVNGNFDYPMSDAEDEENQSLRNRCIEDTSPEGSNAPTPSPNTPDPLLHQ